MSAFKILAAIIAIIFALFVVSSLLTVSDSQINEAVDSSQRNLYNTTLALAFIGGVLTVFAPCLFPILTAYFANTFKEKTEMTKSTFIFFLGFVTVFIPFGFSVSLLGQILRVHYISLVTASGIIIALFGLLTIFGKGFSFVKKLPSTRGPIGTYILGALFTLGWAPCVGPILFSILFLAANLPNIAYTTALLVIYSLGMWLPLFIMSYFMDRQKIYKSSWLTGKLVKIGKFSVNTTNLAAGVLLIFLGLIYIIFKGTAFLNVNTLWTQSYVLQGFVLSSEFFRDYGNYIAYASMAIIALIAIYLYRKRINIR